MIFLKKLVTLIAIKAFVVPNPQVKMCVDIHNTSALYCFAKKIIMFEMFLPVNDLPFRGKNKYS